ncbi:T-cell leukemia homeobox protein 1 isoform X3 [Pithys albifrons albifrons]|uniref:T-cell leukemia homeobox protein 1 isoform X3 n=1 Tax=Pithys albifrons albifrons TaxID=3385563 RepID=UPI003A5CFBF4
MEHLGAHHLHQGQAEPISFGIDQILNTSEPGSCMVSHPRLQDSADYGLGCIVGSAYNTVTGGYGASGGAAGAYTGTSCSMGGLPGSYNVNMAVSMNGNTLSSAGGVIRVPAHRPVAGGVHQPLSAAVPAVNGMNSLTGLTFPWMESNRRYTKDRFTGSGKAGKEENEWQTRHNTSREPRAQLPVLCRRTNTRGNFPLKRGVNWEARYGRWEGSRRPRPSPAREGRTVAYRSRGGFPRPRLSAQPFPLSKGTFCSPEQSRARARVSSRTCRRFQV